MESASRGPAHDCQGSPWCLSGAYPEIFNGPYTPPGQPEQDRATWAAVMPDTDLRTLPHQLRDRYSLMWIFVRGSGRGPDDRSYFTLEPFQMGVPLGPLASVQVYASDPTGEVYNARRFAWGRKSHGLGCQHAEFLEPEWHQLLSLEEFLPLLPRPYSDVAPSIFTPEGRAWYDECDRWCSKCGGYAIRRFTDEQCTYYTDQVHAFWETQDR